MDNYLIERNTHKFPPIQLFPLFNPTYIEKMLKLQLMFDGFKRE